MREFDGVLGCWCFVAIGDRDLRRATRLIARNGRFKPLGVLPIKVEGPGGGLLEPHSPETPPEEC